MKIMIDQPLAYKSECLFYRYDNKCILCNDSCSAESVYENETEPTCQYLEVLEKEVLQNE